MITNPPPDLITRFLLPETPPAHLRNPITVVISPTSGVGGAEGYFRDAVRPILDIYSLEYQTVVTTSGTSIREIAAGLSDAPHTLIMLSGDTLIFELLNALPEGARPTIAIIPTGTGNALSSSFHKSSNALHTLLLGTAHPLPGFTATFSPGATIKEDAVPEGGLRGSVVASWGFHAALVADSDSPELRTTGVERFQQAARANINPLHAYRGTLLILRPSATDWEAVEDRDERGHFYTVVTGVSNFEQHFTISPDARGVSGILRLVYFGIADVNNRGDSVMEIMSLAYRAGDHVSRGRVRYEPVDALRIEMNEPDERWRRVCVDGEIVQVEEGGWVEVRRHGGWADVVYRE